MDINIKISQKILSLIKQRGMTRADLAKSIRADKYKLDNYLQNKAKWDINFVIRICDVLKISILELIEQAYSSDRKQSA